MKSVRVVTAFLALLLPIQCLLAGGAKPATPSQEIVEQIVLANQVLKREFETLNRDSLEKARAQFIEILSKTDGRDPYALYYTALADYRLVIYHFARGKSSEADSYIQDGLKCLELATKLLPNFADAYALYGTLLGFEISLKPSQSMVLGMKIPQYFEKALQQEPRNPRVNFLMGRNLLYTPEAYGGGLNKAIEYIEKAIEYYSQERLSDPLKPSWGYEEACTELGVLYYERKNDRTRAEALLKKALEVNPNYGYAQHKLAELSKQKEH